MRDWLSHLLDGRALDHISVNTYYRGMGRPKGAKNKAPLRTPRRQCMVRLSTEEHAATSRAAQARGLTWSAWAREALLFVAENGSDLEIDMGENKLC